MMIRFGRHPDLTISCGEVSFEVNRAVLREASPVFDAMLEEGKFAEGLGGRVVLKGDDPSVLQKVFGVVYGNPCPTDLATLDRMAVVADKYQFESVGALIEAGKTTFEEREYWAKRVNVSNFPFSERGQNGLPINVDEIAQGQSSFRMAPAGSRVCTRCGEVPSVSPGDGPTCFIKHRVRPTIVTNLDEPAVKFT
jgi:hypothetical protein